MFVFSVFGSCPSFPRHLQIFVHSPSSYADSLMLVLTVEYRYVYKQCCQWIDVCVSVLYEWFAVRSESAKAARNNVGH